MKTTFGDVQVDIKGEAKDGQGTIFLGLHDDANKKWMLLRLTPQQAEQLAEGLKAGVDQAAIALGGDILADVSGQCTCSLEDLLDEDPSVTNLAAFDEETGTAC